MMFPDVEHLAASSSDVQEESLFFSFFSSEMRTFVFGGSGARFGLNMSSV